MDNLDKAGLTLKERRDAVKWAEDTSWIDNRLYEQDEEYMEYVGDIRFSSQWKSIFSMDTRHVGYTVFR